MIQAVFFICCCLCSKSLSWRAETKPALWMTHKSQWWHTITSANGARNSSISSTQSSEVSATTPAISPGSVAQCMCMGMCVWAYVYISMCECVGDFSFIFGPHLSMCEAHGNWRTVCLTTLPFNQLADMFVRGDPSRDEGRFTDVLSRVAQHTRNTNCA